MPKKLYQEHPRQKSKYPGYKSKTESLESFRLDAISEWGSLHVNGTIPNHIVQLNYLSELSVEEIQALWKKHSRRLYRAGIVARVAIEITKGRWKQRPANKVHYHFVVKDHTRTRDELKELFIAVCMCEMKKSAFVVNVFPFDEDKGGWEGYMAYFVKLKGKDENILFEEKLGLRKYFTIGKWWTDEDGTPISVKDIKKKKQRYASTKAHLKRSEKFIEVKHQVAEWEIPTDPVKLQELLDRKTDETLYDWFSILLGLPTVFQTSPPTWLLDDIQRQPLKLKDLLDTLYERLRHTTNPDIVFAFKIYHKHDLME